MTNLPSTKSTAREIAWSYWLAEIERDVDKVMAHYHPDAVFIHNGNRLQGHEQIKTFYEDSCSRFPKLEVEIVGENGSGPVTALEWKAAVTDKSGSRVQFVGVNLVTITEGKFREVRAYFDTSALP